MKARKNLFKIYLSNIEVVKYKYNAYYQMPDNISKNIMIFFGIICKIECYMHIYIIRIFKHGYFYR